MKKEWRIYSAEGDITKRGEEGDKELLEVLGAVEREHFTVFQIMPFDQPGSNNKKTFWIVASKDSDQ